MGGDGEELRNYRLLRAPFPWFGGKSRVAHLVWERFGNVRNFVEPFAGSLAVLLARPNEPKIETINDVDAYLSNFWRAVAADPDQVAHFADWPVNEADLHARHRWLVETARERVERVKTDPDYFDAKVAGWWVWGQCLWIGSGWCAAPEWRGRGESGKLQSAETAARRAAKGPIVHNRRPHLLNEGEGVVGVAGAYAKSRSRDPEWEQRPDLSSGTGRGIISEKRQALIGNGGGVGVNRPGLAHQVPNLSGDSGAAGRGIRASGFLAKSGGLQEYMRALSDRLRRVRVCCGDFERILGPAVTTCIGLTGVFLDPPYPTDGRAICYSHDSEEVWWRAREWALANAADPLLRIAFCGYEREDLPMPEDWECVAWKASGGYGRSERGKANALRERIWFSPGCLKPARHRGLFDYLERSEPVQEPQGLQDVEDGEEDDQDPDDLFHHGIHGNEGDEV